MNIPPPKIGGSYLHCPMTGCMRSRRHGTRFRDVTGYHRHWVRVHYSPIADMITRARTPTLAIGNSVTVTIPVTETTRPNLDVLLRVKEGLRKA